jgi:hypothetical protein
MLSVGPRKTNSSRASLPRWKHHPFDRRCRAGRGPAKRTKMKSKRELRMRYAGIFVAVLISASNSWSQTADANESTPDMVHYCQNLERGQRGNGEHIRIPNTKQALLCWGYMQAMQDISVLVTSEGRRLVGSCPPEQTRLLQLIHIFIRHERSKREKEHGNTASAVIRALQEAFPCNQQRVAAQK